jgi:hypothetical protein
MTIPELRVSGAPILVVRADGHTVSGVFLAHDVDGFCAVFFDNAVWLAAVESCALDLHHPNGERIADLVLRPGAPTADRETLEGIRDAVLRAVSA